MKINENRLRQIILEEVGEKLVLFEIRQVINEMELNLTERGYICLITR
jgi:hypothetical protein